MESEVIWTGGGIPIPARLSGRVVRSINQSGASVTERFSALLEVGRFGPEDAGPDDKYLCYHADSARIVDVQPFHDLPGRHHGSFSRTHPGSLSGAQIPSHSCQKSIRK
jgi:hypothetical protein